MSTAHPHSIVIDRLGGSTPVARLCRIKPQAVSQWRRSGIPQARLDYLRLLKPEAFEVDKPELIGTEGAPEVVGDQGTARELSDSTKAAA